jgi:hypothetical protein
MEPGPDLVPQTPNPDEVGAVISVVDYVVSVGEEEICDREFFLRALLQEYTVPWP